MRRDDLQTKKKGKRTSPPWHASLRAALHSPLLPVAVVTQAGEL